MTDFRTPKDHIILVPVDFTDTSTNAVEYAIKLARLLDNEIALLHVVEKGMLTGKDTMAKRKEEAREKINAYKDEFQAVNPKIKVNCIIKQGDVFKTIEKVAEAINCDTIVVGTSPKSVTEKFLGQTTKRIINRTSKPVIAVKKKHTDPKFNDIVVPIDLSRESKQKLVWAAKLGIAYKAKVHIILEEEHDEFLAQRVRANANHASEVMQDNNVDFEVNILGDEEYPEHFGIDTIQYSEKINADLILVTTHSEGGLKQVFTGTYAQQVLDSECTIPVMAIQPIKTTLNSNLGNSFY